MLILRVKTPERYPLQPAYYFDLPWVNCYPTEGEGKATGLGWTLNSSLFPSLCSVCFEGRDGRTLSAGPLCHLPRNPSRVCDIPLVGPMPVLSPLPKLWVLWCVCTQPCVLFSFVRYLSSEALRLSGLGRFSPKYPRCDSRLIHGSWTSLGLISHNKDKSHGPHCYRCLH